MTTVNSDLLRDSLKRGSAVLPGADRRIRLPVGRGRAIQ
jgi:hypothetical protein